MSAFFHRISRHTNFVTHSVLILIGSGSVILTITLSLIYYFSYLVNMPTFSLLTFILMLYKLYIYIYIYIYAGIPRLMLFHI